MNAMLKTVNLPARISDLDPSLADVDQSTLSHFQSNKTLRKIRNPKIKNDSK